MGQKFIARERYRFANGAIGWRPGGPFDCLGPFAKVENCPVDGSPFLRRTCYATNYADTFFSVPACTRIGGVHVSGFFTMEDDAIKFVPYSRFDKLIGKADVDELCATIRQARKFDALLGTGATIEQLNATLATIAQARQADKD